MSNKIFTLIPKVMAEVGYISKDRNNTQGSGYKFRGIDDVLAAFHGPFVKHGVFCAPSVLEHRQEDRQSKSGGLLIYTVLRVQFRFYADDGSFFEAITSGEAMDSGDKSSNKAMSAAMKYAIIQVFCVPTEGDNDTENHSPDPIPRGLPRSTVGGASALPAPVAPSSAPAPVVTPKSNRLEQPPTDGSAGVYNPGTYRFTFGKFGPKKGTGGSPDTPGRPVAEIPRNEAEEYVAYLKERAAIENKTMSASVQRACDAVLDYWAGVDALAIEQENAEHKAREMDAKGVRGSPVKPLTSAQLRQIEAQSQSDNIPF